MSSYPVRCIIRKKFKGVIVKNSHDLAEYEANKMIKKQFQKQLKEYFDKNVNEYREKVQRLNENSQHYIYRPATLIWDNCAKKIPFPIAANVVELMDFKGSNVVIRLNGKQLQSTPFQVKEYDFLEFIPEQSGGPLQFCSVFFILKFKINRV